VTGPAPLQPGRDFGPPAAGEPLRTRLYRHGRLQPATVPVQDLARELAADPDATGWVDLRDPDETDLQVVVDGFGLHPLAVEDAVSSRQRPKLDRYPTHLFVTTHAVSVDEASSQVTTTPISAFVTRQMLITVHRADFDVETLLARWDVEPAAPAVGVGGLLHGLLDLVVDGQYAAVQGLNDTLDELQEAVFDTPSEVDVRRQGFEVRRNLVALRRVIPPMREVLERLLRNEPHLIEDALLPYYADVHDHVLHAAEDLDSARDLLTGVLDTALTEQGNDLNVVTRKLAAWAAIIAVPTAVTGFYGQNVPYPGFSQHWGFVTSSVVILSLSGLLYLLLRRNRWL
jgi:magnesium transporter